MLDRKPPPEVDAEWNDNSDVILVSSDNVAFHVASYHLASQSVVLRDTLTIGDSTLPSVSHPKRIELLDEVCETADCIRFFLLAVTGGNIYTHLRAKPRSIIRILLGTLFFCKKYDCSAVTQVIKLWLHQHVVFAAHRDVSLSPLDVFVIACKLEMYDLATDAIRYWQPPPWGKDEHRELEKTRRDPQLWSGCNLNSLHPGEMDYQVHEELSKLVIHVLCQVYSSKKVTHMSQQMIAEEFAETIDIAIYCQNQEMMMKEEREL
ncbi:hypothetical protein IAT38_003125 [Cryptococcus sp. DSM 104549]